ncbi:hypothetical protein C4G52_RS22200 [Vibrio parahaemolyticus]|nr:hypothetical protein [Vibrio parahaemolyticus]EMB2742751.1 hypothetical protein [Vibrio parahaemolyticus]HCG8352197.1 hypothetical protein [Vibrio parahaemolyticus]
MTCIRHRYHYGSILINEHKAVAGEHVTGNTIPAKRKNGELAYEPYGGVCDYAFKGKMQKVKLVNIISFFWDDDGMTEEYAIPLNHVVLGFFMQGKYFIAIKDDKPIHWEEETPRTNYHTNNVHGIRGRR